MKNLFLRNPSKFVAVAGILLIALFVVAPVYGQTIPTPDPDVPRTWGGLVNLINSVFNILFIALMLFAGIFIILAAFAYLTAGGEPEKIQKANHRVIYAAVAVAVGLFAKAIPLIVENFIEAGA